MYASTPHMSRLLTEARRTITYATALLSAMVFGSERPCIAWVDGRGHKANQRPTAY